MILRSTKEDIHTKPWHQTSGVAVYGAVCVAECDVVCVAASVAAYVAVCVAV